MCYPGTDLQHRTTNCHRVWSKKWLLIYNFMASIYDDMLRNISPCNETLILIVAIFQQYDFNIWLLDYMPDWQLPLWINNDTTSIVQWVSPSGKPCNTCIIPIFWRTLRPYKNGNAFFVYYLVVRKNRHKWKIKSFVVWLQGPNGYSLEGWFPPMAFVKFKMASSMLWNHEYFCSVKSNRFETNT